MIYVFDSSRASAFSRYRAYVRIVADDPAAPDHCRSSSVHAARPRGLNRTNHDESRERRGPVDSSAIIEIFLRGPDHGAVYNALTDFVNSDKVCFCDDVLAELERLARNEPPHMWAKAVEKSRCNKDAVYKHKIWAAQQAPDLVDVDAEFGSAACVLAQARELISLQQKIRVVTEEISDKPTRAALAVVCRRLDVPVMRLQECLEELGIVTTTSPGA